MIIKIARIVVCEKCKLHAHIAFPDGSSSEEFFSQKQAMETISRALLDQKIIPAEAEFLRSEARKLTLLVESGLVSAVVQMTVQAVHAAQQGQQSSPAH